MERDNLITSIGGVIALAVGIATVLFVRGGLADDSETNSANEAAAPASVASDGVRAAEPGDGEGPVTTNDANPLFHVPLARIVDGRTEVGLPGAEPDYIIPTEAQAVFTDGAYLAGEWFQVTYHDSVDAAAGLEVAGGFQTAAYIDGRKVALVERFPDGTQAAVDVGSTISMLDLEDGTESPITVGANPVEDPEGLSTGFVESWAGDRGVLVRPWRAELINHDGQLDPLLRLTNELGYGSRCPGAHRFRPETDGHSLSADGRLFLWIHEEREDAGITRRTELRLRDLDTGTTTAVPLDFPPTGDGTFYSVEHAGRWAIVTRGLGWGNAEPASQTSWIVNLDEAPGELTSLPAGRHQLLLGTDTGGTRQVGEAPEPDAQCEDHRISIYGIGEIRVGMPADEAVTYLDPIITGTAPGGVPPLAADLARPLGADCGWVGDLEWVAIGDIGLAIAPDGTIGAISTRHIRTPSGFGHGSTADAIIERFGDQIVVTEVPDERAGRATLDFIPTNPAESHLTVRFHVSDNEVFRIEAGRVDLITDRGSVCG